MAFAIAAGRHPKFPTHQPITKSMYFLPRESVTKLPLVTATCSSAGSSLARGVRRRAGIKAILSVRSDGDAVIHRISAFVVIGGRSRHHPPTTLDLFTTNSWLPADC
jgi:hypothetical protein